MTTFAFGILAVLIIAACGLLVQFFARRAGFNDSGITKTEFVIALLVASFVIIPTVSVVGSKTAKANAAAFNEWWNGWEDKAFVKTTRCERNGSCSHTYRCDSYVVMVDKTRQEPYTTTETYTNADGTTGFRTVTKYKTVHYQEPETRWNSCPYVTEEHSYIVTDTFKRSHSFGSHLFPAGAESKRWKGLGYNDPEWGFGMPKLPKVKQGVPKEFAIVKARIDAGKPNGVVKRVKYKNFVQASSNHVFEKASSAISKYQADGLMPSPTAKIRKPYSADKMYFMGGTEPKNSREWQDALGRLNAALGTEKQGDLHVVAVPANRITDPAEYAQAIEAYWQSPALGKNTFSKNGVALVLGVNGDSVTWSRSFTGMPMGNEGLVVALSDVSEPISFTPEALFEPGGRYASALLDEKTGFKRVEMKAYEFLYDSMDISTTARIVILIVSVFVSCLLWGVMLAVNVRFHPIEQIGKTLRKDSSSEASFV